MNRGSGSGSRIALLLVLYALALGWQAWRLGVTVDEPSHLARAYTYWLRQDILSPPDTPPLTWMTSGWVPLLWKAPLRRDTTGWRNQWAPDVGRDTLHAMDAAAARRLIFLTRLTYLVFPLLTVWLVWQWGRHLFGESIALALAACTALEPTLLGHGGLLKADVAAAAACLLCSYQAWRYWREATLRRAAALAFCLLIAVLAKFTLLVLAPVGVGLVLWRGPRVTGIPILLGTLYAGLLAGYLFVGVKPIEEAQLEQMRRGGLSAREVAVARMVGRLPWPEQFVRGLHYVVQMDRGQGPPAYMLGRKIEFAAPWYFPLAWSLKFPIPLQLLAVAGIIASVIRFARKQAGIGDALVWTPPALVMAAAVQSHIHMGFRHLMPALPLLILGGGFAMERWISKRAFRAAAAVCLVWLAVAAARIYPQGISYFNEWAGGAENGWKYLADSNIDWGQNLPELAEYVVEHNVAQIRLYYFGFDLISHYLPDEKVDIRAAPWDATWARERRLEPSPGVYAISVNALVGHFFPADYADYFAYFKARAPDARAGYSIFIYEVK